MTLGNGVSEEHVLCGSCLGDGCRHVIEGMVDECRSRAVVQDSKLPGHREGKLRCSCNASNGVDTDTRRICNLVAINCACRVKADPTRLANCYAALCK